MNKILNEETKTPVNQHPVYQMLIKKGHKVAFVTQNGDFNSENG
ncbi:MAG: hypothetical protein ABH849_00595 [Nanoarchaeota archaeon]